ncbi:hypothetical protein IQ268_11125 [Oculatella sp. LEGE 06141]|uniref:hypothetical protein n=1 Tax=Oculatella sp. LEGE 06141 TaxID=1828648 RepID=UPI00188183C2|nr:hypothetical protein [Oculatella sp. LEGE 06141]MBE9179113.1 hypothetical protein [Oculatella sp. LEGE 06141]
MVRAGRPPRPATDPRSLGDTGGQDPIENPTFDVGPFHVGPDAEPPRPLGDDAGFRIDPPPDRPVDPTDCEHYPSSPFCGGTPPLPPTPIPGINPPAQLKVTSAGCNNCECWLCFEGRLFGAATPNVCISYRKANCIDPPKENPIPPIPDGPPPGNPVEFDQPNNTGEGWIANCRYFVYVRNSVYRLPHEKLPMPDSPALNAWNPTGTTDLRDYIIPAYGPIVGLKYRYSYTNFDGVPWYDIFLVSGGLGQYPYEFTNQTTQRTRIFKWEAGFFTDAVFTNRPSFLFPGVASHRKPHDELFYNAPGERLDFNGIPTYFYDEAVPRFIMRAPITVIYSVVQAGKVEPHVYADGTRAFYGYVCGPPSPPPPIPPNPPDMACCSCEDIARLIDRKLKPIYKILGFEPADLPKIKINPDELIKTLGESVYPTPEGEEIDIYNMIQLIGAVGASNYFKAGYQDLPAKLPSTLLAYSDGAEPEELKTELELTAWFIKQFDALIGQFPIKMSFQDGEEETAIELPNISETLAELYGLTQTATSNTDLSINFLTRLAAELISVKNSSLITQDHAKGISAFLGYKGNPKPRTIGYAFDPSHLDSIQNLLNESYSQIIGWENEDKETVANYLMRLSFSAGIIKAVFMRNGSQISGLQNQIESLFADGDSDLEGRWQAFVQYINSPNARFNNASPFNPQPSVVDKTVGDEPTEGED